MWKMATAEPNEAEKKERKRNGNRDELTRLRQYSIEKTQK
jgi:hypothetical protein